MGRAKWGIRMVVAAVVGVVPFAIAVPAAFAGAGVGATPSFPATVTVGQSNLPASLQILNNSTPPESSGNLTINFIRLVPACGTFSVDPSGDCPAPSADPGVISLSPTAVGEAGTACAGVTFSVAVINPNTGQVQFNPSSPIVLSAPATPGAVCRIDFSFSVNKAPVHPTGISGTTYHTDAIASVNGTSSVTGVSATGTGSAVLNINQAQPGLTTSATPSAQVGGTINDTAILSAATPPGPPPTGTITFSVFNDPTCAGVALFTSTVAITRGPGNYSSAQFAPSSPGTYRWVATYSGDSNNRPAATACGDPGETSTVSKTSPTIVTRASPPTTIGGQISDVATLSGGLNPTGTITFSAFGPGNSTCSGAAVFISTVVVNGNGTYLSQTFTPTAAGSYFWVALYSGDANNGAAATACGDPGEISTVSQAAPGLVTTASPAVPLGGAISDSATLSGGFNPTGTITFDVFGPNDANCTGSVVFASLKAVTGNGTYVSDPFTPTVPGIYRFRAAYSGDANNSPVALTPCGAPGESVKVGGARTPGDYDGDGKTDVGVFRPSNGVWYINRSAGGTTIVNWGSPGDIPVTGDYDGDGKTDIAVFRPSTGIWYIQLSSGGTRIVNWGASGDTPVPGDYNGDGKTDIAVFRPSTGIWYIQLSGGGTKFVDWGGVAGDVPVPGNYEGNGVTDVAVYRPSSGLWYINQNTGGTKIVNWGGPGYAAVPGDYDGDGKTDVAVFNGGFWYINGSTIGTKIVNWGDATDIPVPGYYDGSGKTNLAVFRPSTNNWYIQPSGGGVTALNWGAAGDIPNGKPPSLGTGST